MVLKGLLVVASGFAFIFASGIPMRMLGRFRPDYKKDGLYWGIGIWIIAFFVSNFLQSLVKQIATHGEGQVSGWVPYLLGAVLTMLLLQIGMRIFLRKRAVQGEDIDSDGLALGFGIGVITQIFTGLSLIGAGAGLMFQGFGMQTVPGTVQSGTIEMISSANFLSLLAALLSMIFYRMALLTVSSVQGYLVAGSLKGKAARFWSALLVAVAFSWVIFFVQWALGTENPGQILGITSPFISLVSIAYYAIVFYLGYRWLAGELGSAVSKKSKKGAKNDGRK
ncbi:MAG: hypothetical protein HPY72_09310 [Anaerolineae bacterium]|nr:hypothetical protein [Anaerolineae bacterium]